MEWLAAYSRLGSVGLCEASASLCVYHSDRFCHIVCWSRFTFVSSVDAAADYFVVFFFVCLLLRTVKLWIWRQVTWLAAWQIQENYDDMKTNQAGHCSVTWRRKTDRVWRVHIVCRRCARAAFCLMQRTWRCRRSHRNRTRLCDDIPTMLADTLFVYSVYYVERFSLVVLRWVYLHQMTVHSSDWMTTRQHCSVRPCRMINTGCRPRFGSVNYTIKCIQQYSMDEVILIPIVSTHTAECTCNVHIKTRKNKNKLFSANTRTDLSSHRAIW